MQAAGELAGHEAFVVGSAVYMRRWMEEACEFVRRNRTLLADRPVWLFSSGPLGGEATDAQGRDLAVVAEPTESPGSGRRSRPASIGFSSERWTPANSASSQRLLRKLPAARARCSPRATFATGPRSRPGPARSPAGRPSWRRTNAQAEEGVRDGPASAAGSKRGPLPDALGRRDSQLLIDEFLPRYDFAVVHASVLPARPEACYRAALAVDLLRDPVIRTLLGR